MPTSAGPPRGLGGQRAPVGHRVSATAPPGPGGTFKALGQGALSRGRGWHVNPDVQHGGAQSHPLGRRSRNGPVPWDTQVPDV